MNSARGKTGDDLPTEVAKAVRDDGEPVRPAASEPVYDCGPSDEAAYLMRRRRADSIRARAICKRPIKRPNICKQPDSPELGDSLAPRLGPICHNVILEGSSDALPVRGRSKQLK